MKKTCQGDVDKGQTFWQAFKQSMREASFWQLFLYRYQCLLSRVGCCSKAMIAVAVGKPWAFFSTGVLEMPVLSLCMPLFLCSVPPDCS